MSALAEKIIRARARGGLVAWSAADVPRDIAGAMRVQAAAGARESSPIAGWKVAVPPGQPAVAAPIYAAHCAGDGGALSLPPGQGLALEAEIFVRLARALPARPGRPYSVDEVYDAVEEARIGIELCPARFAPEPPMPFTLHLANFMANGGYVLGPRIAREKLRAPPLWQVTLLRGAQVFYDAPGFHADGDPLIPLAAYLSAPNDLIGGPRAGQFITLGSLCGAVAVRGRGVFTARLGGLGEVSARVG